MSNPTVFHLASRLLDGVRTTGMGTLRQAEIYNRGDEPVSCRDLRVRIKLYPADERVASISSRVLKPGKATAILARGVDFAEITDIFNPEACNALFDEVSAAPGRGGLYGRIMMPGRIVNIPWEQEDGRWIPEFQWRLVYECARGNVPESILADEEIPKRFRSFLQDLKYVGGDQSLSKVFVCDSLPPVDALRVLKRNGVGVVVIKSINMRDAKTAASPSTTSTNRPMRKSPVCARGHAILHGFDSREQCHVREFKGGFWVTSEGKERISRLHTTVAFFGSVVDELKPILLPQLRHFLRPGSGRTPRERTSRGPRQRSGGHEGRGRRCRPLRHLPHRRGHRRREDRPGNEFLPRSRGAVREHRPEHPPDILDRRSVFKVFNIGGYGTCYEINMALTFMKIGHCLPAPYVFVDPLGLGGRRRPPLAQGHRTVSGAVLGPMTWATAEIPPLGPMWVVNLLPLGEILPGGPGRHKVVPGRSGRVLKTAGIEFGKVVSARDNLAKAGLVIPPYIDRALELAGIQEIAGAGTSGNGKTDRDIIRGPGRWSRGLRVAGGPMEHACSQGNG